MHLPELVQEYDVPALCMENEYVKHNRELKKVLRYLREKGQKTEFEIYLLHHYDFFYEKRFPRWRSFRDMRMPLMKQR